MVGPEQMLWTTVWWRMTTLKTTTQITDINIPIRYSAQQRTAASFLDTVNSHCVSLSESVEYHLEMYGNWIPASRTGRLNCKNSARQENIRTHGLLLTSSLPLSPTTTNRAPCFVYTPFSIKTRMLLSTFFSIMLTRSSHVLRPKQRCLGPHEQINPPPHTPIHPPGHQPNSPAIRWPIRKQEPARAGRGTLGRGLHLLFSNNWRHVLDNKTCFVLFWHHPRDPTWSAYTEESAFT